VEYKVISTDDHLQEAPDTWTARMSKAKWGDNIPHVERDADGMDNWYIYGEPRNQLGGPGTVMGAMPDRTVNAKNFDEMPKECYVPSERLKAMQRDGVDVHTFFGNIAGIASNTFTNPDWPADFRLDCITALPRSVHHPGQPAPLGCGSGRAGNEPRYQNGNEWH